MKLRVRKKELSFPDSFTRKVEVKRIVDNFGVQETKFDHDERFMKNKILEDILQNVLDENNFGFSEI